jgi:hypothetical protein
VSGAAGNGLGIKTKYQRDFAGIGPGTTSKNYRFSVSGAAGNGLGDTAKYLPGAASMGLGNATENYRCFVSGAAGYGLVCSNDRLASLVPSH